MPKTHTLDLTIADNSIAKSKYSKNKDGFEPSVHLIVIVFLFTIAEVKI